MPIAPNLCLIKCLPNRPGQFVCGTGSPVVKKEYTWLFIQHVIVNGGQM